MRRSSFIDHSVDRPASPSASTRPGRTAPTGRLTSTINAITGISGISGITGITGFTGIIAIIAITALAGPLLDRVAWAQLTEAAAASARSGTVESPPIRPDLEGAMAGLSLRGQVILVPLVGRIGTDVVADGFEFLAERRESLGGARALVLDVDSDGGSDGEALRIAAALESIRERVPVYMVVRRAIGPAALVLPVADGVLIREPSLSGVIIAYQPESRPGTGLEPEAVVRHYLEELAAVVARSPRRDAWQSIVTDPSRWRFSASEAYALKLAEPLDGGPAAIGRVLKIEPWIPSGRQVEEVIRRGNQYSQQLQVFRTKLLSRAFGSLAQANETIGAIASAEQTAFELDPRRQGVAVAPRLESVNGRWIHTPASVSAWNRACEQSAAAWERVATLCDDAHRHLKSVTGEIGVLVSTASMRPIDPMLPDAIDRLERERADLDTRVAPLRSRAADARAASRELLELRLR